jgi:hypothetical protein
MDDILRTIGAFIVMAILGTLIYLFYIDIKKDLTVIDTKVETINVKFINVPMLTQEMMV